MYDVYIYIYIYILREREREREREFYTFGLYGESRGNLRVEVGFSAPL